MKKTLTINLNGTVFNIDEDAYAALKSYLSDVEKHLPADDSQEIMNDIEARIAELFSDKLRQGKTVVTLDDVNFIIEIMGKPSQYADAEDTNDEKPSDEKEEKKKTSRRFYRDPEKAILGGICAGLEAYTGIDKVLWRIAMIVLTFVGWGLIIPIYFLIWLISPKAVTVAQRLEMSGKDVTIENIKDGFTSAKNYMESDEFKSSAKSIGQRLGEVCMFCFKLVGGFFGVIFGIVGFAILAALIALLVAVIAEPSLSPEFFTGFTAENAIMMLISILLVVGCPIFSIIYGVIRLLTKDKARSAVPQWISLILWLAGLFMLISTAIKSELSPANFKHYNIELLDGESTFGNDTTDVRTLPHFTKIKASGAVKVIFVQDSVQNVRVVAPTKMLDRIYTTVEGEKLIISTRKLRNYASKVEIYLANDSIYQYQGRGATRFIADKYISTSHFNLDLSGASKAQVDSLFTTDFTSEISGASNAEIAGKTISSKIKLNGASHLKANGFISTTAIVDVNGASSANVNVEQSIDANASGASKIRYIGNPTVKSIKSSGSSSIKAINND